MRSKLYTVAFATMVAAIICNCVAAYLAPAYLDELAVRMSYGRYFGYPTGILILMLVSLIAGPCMSLPSVIMFRFAVLGADTWMYAICVLLPLLWCLPMVVKAYKILIGKSVNTRPFAIMVLFCFNFVAGMLLLSAIRKGNIGGLATADKIAGI